MSKDTFYLHLKECEFRFRECRQLIEDVLFSV